MRFFNTGVHSAAMSATSGIGGSKVADAILDSRRKDIPMHLTFNRGENQIHIDHETLAKLSGVQIANQINPSAFTFGASTSDASHTSFVSASLGPPDDKQPLHTLDRTAHISSSESTTPGHSIVTTAHHVISPQTVWDRGPTVIKLQNMQAAYGPEHPGSTHIDCVTPDHLDVQQKQAANWRESIGASEKDIMHGCVTAEKGGNSRTSIPIDNDARMAIQKGQLSSLVMKHASNLTELLGEHHITDELYNQALQKSVRHVVVPTDVATQAMQGLKANLQKGPLANGMTFKCTSASGVAPDGDVHVAVTMHRDLPDIKDVPGAMPITSVDASSQSANAPGATPGSGISDAMFASTIKFRKQKNGAKPQPPVVPAPVETVTIHGGAQDTDN